MPEVAYPGITKENTGSDKGKKMKAVKHMAKKVSSHLEKDIKESRKSIMEDKKLKKTIKKKKPVKLMGSGY